MDKHHFPARQHLGFLAEQSDAFVFKLRHHANDVIHFKAQVMHPAAALSQVKDRGAVAQ